VHANNSFIFLQIAALGRAARDPSIDLVGPSDIPLAGSSRMPRPMTLDDIKDFVDLFATAASNAVHKSGFDGVEIHGECID
jgi:NADPH2 dehydrogenase